MKSVEIYTGAFCGYCKAAKNLLTKKGVKFIEYDVSNNPEKRIEMTKRSNGGRSVPQIFIGDIHIGGSDELHRLESTKKLDKILAD